MTSSLDWLRIVPANSPYQARIEQILSRIAATELGERLRNIAPPGTITEIIIIDDASQRGSTGQYVAAEGVSRIRLNLNDLNATPEHESVDIRNNGTLPFLIGQRP